MGARIVRVSDKGQLSIPVAMRESLEIEKGDEILLIQEGERIILEKVQKSTFHDLLVHSEAVMKKVWSSKEDDVWDSL